MKCIKRVSGITLKIIILKKKERKKKEEQQETAEGSIITTVKNANKNPIHQKCSTREN